MKNETMGANVPKSTAEKVINTALLLSLAFGFWYYMRSLMTYITIVYFDDTITLILGNVIVAALLGGGIMYLVVSSVFKKALHPYSLSGVNNNAIEYKLKIALIIANVVYGGFSFFYLLQPLMATYCEYIVRLIFYTAALVIAMVICIKNGDIKNEFIGRSLYVVFSTYFITYGIIVIIKLIMFYMMGVI